MKHQGAKCHSYSYVMSLPPNIVHGQVLEVNNHMLDPLVDRPDQQASIRLCIQVVGIMLYLLYYLETEKIKRKQKVSMKSKCVQIHIHIHKRPAFA